MGTSYTVPADNHAEEQVPSLLYKLKFFKRTNVFGLLLLLHQDTIHVLYRNHIQQGTSPNVLLAQRRANTQRVRGRRRRQHRGVHHLHSLHPLQLLHVLHHLVLNRNKGRRRTNHRSQHWSVRRGHSHGSHHRGGSWGRTLR